MRTNLISKTITTLFIILTAVSSLRAATDTWTGGSTVSGNWSDVANWGGTAPNTAGDSLVFSGGTRPVSTNDLVASVNSINLNPSAAFTLNGISLTNNSAFTNAAQNNAWNIPLVFGSNIVFSVASGTTLSMNSVLSGTGGFTKTGAGTLFLTNYNNTFTGSASVMSGTLELGNMPGTSTYVYPGSGLSVVNAVLWFDGSSGGTVSDTYNFPNLTGPVNATNATLNFQTSNTAKKYVNGSLNFGGTNSINYISTAYSQYLYLDGVITGNGQLIFNWSGTASGRNFYIQTNGSYSGSVVLNNSPAAGNFNLNYPLGPANYVVSNFWTLAVASNSLDNAASVSLVGATANLTFATATSYGWNDSTAALVLNAGTVTLANNPAAGAQTLSIGSLSGVGGVINNSSSYATTLTVNQTANGTFAGVISDDGNPLSFIQNGTATLALSGADTYSGNTAVNGGILQINGTLASPAVTVNSGGALGGSGTVAGTVTVNFGGGISVAGSGVLTLNSTVTLGAATALNFQGNGTGLPGVAVTGGNALINNGTATVNISGAVPTTVPAVYTLVTYSGAVAGTGNFAAGAIPPGISGYITNDTTVSAIELVVTTADTLRWSGSPTNDWDLSGNNNWVYNSSGSPASFQNYEVVTFDDTAANFAVNVAAAVTPGSVTVSNNVNNYTFSGVGKITGLTALTKNGTANLTLATANDYTGLTTVNGGVLQLGDGVTNSGSVGGGIADNATVVFANPSVQNYAGVISGSGSVAKQSAGTLTISGNNTYDGATTISGGTVVAGNTNALGSTVGGTTVNTGGALDINGQNLGAEAVSIAGTGPSTNGVIVNSGAQQEQALQSLTLNANSTIGGNSRWDVRGSSSTLNLNGNTLTKTGTNQITLVNSTVSDGNIVVNQGELEFQAGVIFEAGLGQIIVNPSGTLGVSDFGVTDQVSQPIALNGGTLQSDVNGITGTLNSPVMFTSNSTIYVNCPLYLANPTNAVSGTGLLTVDGTSTLVLDSPTNTWSGGLVITPNATVQLGNNDGNGALPSSVGVVTNNGLLAYAMTTDMNFSQAMTGSGGIEQAGSDNLTMTNPQSYIGTTVLANGTLTLAGGNNTLSNVTTVSFIGSSTLNSGTNSQAVSGLTVDNTGLNPNNNTSANIDGTGTFSVTGANAFLLGSTNQNFDPSTITLNLSGLNSFSYDSPSNQFSVGGLTSPVLDANSTLMMALTNSITASQFGVANNGGYPGYTSTGTASLGQVNVINANTVAVGYAGIGFTANGTLNYAGASNPTLKIRATDGVSRANVYVGYEAASDYAAGTGVLDLYDNVNGNSTLDALVGNLIIGQHNYVNVNQDQAGQGTFIMANGLLDATNIVIGQQTDAATRSGYVAANGQLTLYGGTINVVKMLIGDQQHSNALAVFGEFDLNGGMLLAQAVLAGGGANFNTIYRTFNWNGGVIANYTNAGLTISNLTLSLNNNYGTPTFAIASGQSGTLIGGAPGADVSALSGSTSIAKTGAGSLTLNGDITGFSGTLTNQVGTLYVNGPMTSGSVEVFSGATLAGNNALASAQIDNGGSIQPGNAAGAGSLTNNALNLGVNSTDTTYSQFNPTLGGIISAGMLNVNGTNLVNITGTLLPGTNNLISYTGGNIGGNGFSGFQLASLPASATGYLQNDTIDGVVQLVVTAGTISTTPPKMTTSVSGNTLTISWPADHLGWRLLTQTNTLNVGLSTNWFTVPDSTNLTSVPVTISPAAPTVFFRLVYP